MFAITLFAVLSTLPPAATDAKKAPAPPPGLVLIPGGETKVGTPVAGAEAIILAKPELARPLAGETPQFKMAVEDFYLMPSEVTVEQYGAYVRATGARPPWTWGAETVEAARRAFLDEQGRLSKEARDKGQRFEQKVFDPDAWWADHWRDKESKWSVPADQLDQPVVYVSYRDAQAYARWAGQRLMTEFEFYRAARRNSDRVYPWGDEFDVRACSSSRAGMGRTMAVGTYPSGAVEGIHDLAGNVWEWTSSPYEAFPGYKPFRIKGDKRTIEAIAPFDPNQRVLVGGSFQQDEVGVRIATRMWAERSQSTDALGFRCAASLRPGVDTAVALLESDVKYNVLPAELEFSPGDAVVLQVWHSKPGSRGEKLPGDGEAPATAGEAAGEGGDAAAGGTAAAASQEEPALPEAAAASAGKSILPGYRVVIGYERLLFVPAKAVPGNSIKELDDTTLTAGPLYLGILSIDRPLLEPALVAGSYHVAYRAAGVLAEAGAAPPAEEGAGELPGVGPAPFTEAMGFNPEQSQFFFFDLEGTPLVTMPASAFRYDRPPRNGGAVVVERWVPPKKVDEANPPIPMDTLRFQLFVPSKGSPTKAFLFDLALKVETSSITDAWR
ncbi:MAG: SUMF1/EgtB/PvdO family nonheme iron enzyme [Planctomycetota bacterium]